MISYRTTTREDITYIKRLNYLAEVFGDEAAAVDAEGFKQFAAFYVDNWRPEDGVIAFDELGVPIGGTWLLWGLQLLPSSFANIS